MLIAMGAKATHLRMGIAKESDPDFGGIILDPGNYEAKIIRIEIPHERSNQRPEAITEDAQSVLRSEL